jgi:hypothetical protein
MRISYPKKTSKAKGDLDRDMVWQAVAKTGLRAVSQVSVDDVWSAIRFRPAEKLEK